MNTAPWTFAASAPRCTESIPGLFAQVVSEHGGRVAVGTPDVQWSYAELDARSAWVAGQILNRVGAASEPVVLLMEHGALLVAAILGTLKAGKLYLALDPVEPLGRLEILRNNAGARLALTDAANAALARTLMSEQGAVIEIGADASSGSVSDPAVEVLPDAGAWLMYTSGSTGIPKGVWQNHYGVVHHASVYAELIQLAPSDRLSLLTPGHLAASATALFSALLNGAAICPFSVASQGAERLAWWLRDQGITVYHSVPTVFRLLLRTVQDDGVFQSLRWIRLGGEAVLPPDVESFQQRFASGCRLLHALSSTETGLISALRLDKDTPIAENRVSVGRPVHGVEVLLLDEQEQVVPVGQAGRIAVSSAHLARGYWRQPEATARTFQVDPDRLGVRRFVTGDLGRLRADGSLEHLGRADEQVKFRGRRVDLTEVETALRAMDTVADAVAAVHLDASGEQRLVGYVVPHKGAEPTPQFCRQSLRASTPAHLIPTDFVMLTQLPMLPGGKVDRQTLPQPGAVLSKARPRSSRGDHFENRLVQIWQATLGLEAVSTEEDFFELGGDSLRAVQVLVQIEERFGVALSPDVLVAHNTIEKLAALLAERTITASDSPLVELRPATSGRPLFLFHIGKGTVSTYVQLARRLPERPIYGLQSRGLRGECWPLTRVPDMARYYLPEILNRDPSGPYLLAGACMGAMVAFEVAQQLTQLGRAVGLVALFDAATPPFTGRRPWLSDLMIYHVRETARIVRWWPARKRRSGLAPQALPSYRRFVAGMNNRAWHLYRPRFYPHRLTLFHTATPPRWKDRRPLMARHASETEVVIIPGDRQGLFLLPAVTELAHELRAVLERAESR